MTTHGFPAGSLESAIIDDATETVFGIANARLRGNEDDAAAVLTDYIRNTLARGVTDNRAWSLLFAAAVGQFTELLDHRAAEHNRSADEDLQALSLEHARRRG